MTIQLTVWAMRADVPPTEKLILLNLADNGDGWTIFDEEYLAEFCRKPVRRIKKAKTRLAQLGLIQVDQRDTTMVKINEPSST